MSAKLVAPPKSRVSRSSSTTSSSTGTSDGGVRMARRPKPENSVPAGDERAQPPPAAARDERPERHRGDREQQERRGRQRQPLGAGEGHGIRAHRSPPVPGVAVAGPRRAAADGRRCTADGRRSAAVVAIPAQASPISAGRRTRTTRQSASSSRSSTCRETPSAANTTAGSNIGRSATRLRASCSSGSTSTAKPGARASRARCLASDGDGLGRAVHGGAGPARRPGRGLRAACDRRPASGSRRRRPLPG